MNALGIQYRGASDECGVRRQGSHRQQVGTNSIGREPNVRIYAQRRVSNGCDSTLLKMRSNRCRRVTKDPLQKPRSRLDPNRGLNHVVAHQSLAATGSETPWPYLSAIVMLEDNGLKGLPARSLLFYGQESSAWVPQVPCL